MVDKSAEYARETLNALIAGGYFPPELLQLQKDHLALDNAVLRDVEAQLREYYKPQKSRAPGDAPRKKPEKINLKKLVSKLP
ncbi:hypothetical protein PS870_06519 [Pseudomonas fluorescens]|uniref:Uncharacterized protein n=1 Tax=Pseudomonas fluorescens TaxID=294 RepID=A0A5E7QMD3_PSEFL|nr:hypothetical protein [Pseudomonas fluorescens]VVP62057.1 hypothetical protein PS870_06519 [Pseudomonas fluorescens]